MESWRQVRLASDVRVSAVGSGFGATSPQCGVFPGKIETITAMDPEPPPLAAPIPPRVHVTAEDLEGFGDEDLMRRASNDDWLRDEVPPHHRL